jgi:hypothetical protein
MAVVPVLLLGTLVAAAVVVPDRQPVLASVAQAHQGKETTAAEDLQEQQVTSQAVAAVEPWPQARTEQELKRVTAAAVAQHSLQVRSSSTQAVVLVALGEQAAAVAQAVVVMVDQLRHLTDRLEK